MKKILIIMLSCFMISINMYPVLAQQDEYLCEKGEIHLNEFDITIANDNISTIKPKVKKLNNNLDKLLEFCKNKEYKDSIIKSIKNKEDVSIGYSTVYLKEVKDNNGIHYEPIKMNELQVMPYSSSGDISKYSLTFNLTVTSSETSTKRTVNTSTYIFWNPTIAFSGEGRVANGSDDFMTISYSKPYKISINKTTGGMSGIAADKPYLHDISDYAAVAAFRENNGGGYMKANSTQSIQSKKSRRFVAKYVHTWAKVSPTFSLGVNSEGLGTVGISFSPSASAWQISTYVDHSC